MRKMIIRSALVASAFMLFATTLPATARALEDETNDDSSTSQTTDSDRSESVQTKLQAAQDAMEQKREKRLTTAKLKVCENRKKNIATIMTRAGTRVQKQMEVFDKIATRVQVFYAKKGNALANYDELVAAVATARGTTVTDIATLKGMTFDCNGDDPKSAGQAFKSQVEKIRKDLKNYRTAVKNLIVGVKSVNGDKKTEGEQ